MSSLVSSVLVRAVLFVLILHSTSKAFCWVEQYVWLIVAVLKRVVCISANKFMSLSSLLSLSLSRLILVSFHFRSSEQTGRQGNKQTATVCSNHA